MFNEDEENRRERCACQAGAMRFVLFSLCSAVTGHLLGNRKQSLKRALNSKPGSILPPDGILARDKHNTL
jgi:hypothetical protein